MKITYGKHSYYINNRKQVKYQASISRIVIAIQNPWH